MTGGPSWSEGVCAANGVAIRYVRTGGAGAGKPPIVLLHGLTGNGATWAPVARALEGDCDVIMPDARGHGGSGAPRGGYRYDDLASDVRDLISGLALARPLLLGHSMGGMTAALLASRNAALLRGLVLVDPTFLPPERQREVYNSDAAEQHRRLLAQPQAAVIADLRARHPRRSAEMIDLLAAARLATRPQAFDVLTPPNPDYRDLVRALAMPTLLVIGDSPVVTPETATELRDQNPRLRIAQIAEAGHGLPYDQPAQLAAVVAAFLRELA